LDDVEQGERVVRAFGFPQPGGEVHVAVARMLPAAAPPRHDARRFAAMPRSQQAGMLCADPRFQTFFNGGPVRAPNPSDHIADLLRMQLGIASRRELNTDEAAARRWDAIVAEFQQASGQTTEMRG